MGGMAPPSPTPAVEPLAKVYTLGYNKGKVACDIFTSQTLDPTDCAALKMIKKEESVRFSAMTDATEAYNAAERRFESMKSAAQNGARRIGLAPIWWPSPPPGSLTGAKCS